MVARVIATLAVSVVLLAATAGCESEGASTTCTVSGCTVTFDRGVDGAKVNVLGVEIKLVSATADTATIDVAGQQVTVPNNQTAEAGDFKITLKNLTDTEAEIEIAPK